jgi:hypothetical protein
MEEFGDVHGTLREAIDRSGRALPSVIAAPQQVLDAAVGRQDDVAAIR